MSERRARVALLGAALLSSFTIWAVHFQQGQERETMYKGVLKDDERRKEKMKEREEALRKSQKKREIYERVQSVEKNDELNN